MSRLRIAVVVKSSIGGLWTVPHIAELRRRGHDVVVILPERGGRLGDELQRQGVDVLVSPFPFRFRPSLGTLRGLLRLRRMLRDLGVDVVYYHLYAAALACRLATIGRPVRRVHMVAGPLFLESPLIRPVERVLGRLDHLTICGTAYTSDIYGRFGWPAQRRPVVTIGMDDDRFPPPPDPLTGGSRAVRLAKARAELGLDVDAFVVVMVAFVYPARRLVHRGRPIKGHDILLTAWQQFRRDHPDAHLLLVGGGYLAGGVTLRDELIRRFDVVADPSISWMPSVDDVRTYYSSADVSVSPSLSEGHGAAVEASAMGVPSIVSDAGGLPEVIDDSCGWVVPRDDPDQLLAALEEAYTEHLLGRLAERGERAQRKIVPAFGRRLAAEAVADLIEQLTADRPRHLSTGARR